MGFSGFRDPNARRASGKAKAKASKSDSEMDSDEDEDVGSTTPLKIEDADSKADSNNMLSLEDAKRQDEVAEGVQKIRVCPSRSEQFFLIVWG